HFVSISLFRSMPKSHLFPYTTLFRSESGTTRTPGNFEGCVEGEPARHAVCHQQQIFGGHNCRCHYADRTHCGNQDSCNRRNWRRSEEHTSELQSRVDLVCRLLLEKKK